MCPALHGLAVVPAGCVQGEGLPRYDFTAGPPDQRIQVFDSNGYKDYSSLKDDPV